MSTKVLSISPKIDEKYEHSQIKIQSHLIVFHWLRKLGFDLDKIEHAIIPIIVTYKGALVSLSPLHTYIQTPSTFYTSLPHPPSLFYPPRAHRHHILHNKKTCNKTGIPIYQFHFSFSIHQQKRL